MASMTSFEKDEDLVRLLLLEQRHNLAVQDNQLSEKFRIRNSKKNELEESSSSDEPLIDFSSFNSIKVEATPFNECSYKISLSSYTANPDAELEYEFQCISENPEDPAYDLNSLLVSCMNDGENRNKISKLNERIDDNSSKINNLIKEFRSMLSEICDYKRELNKIKESISAYSIEDVKLRKVQRKKGTDCASTGTRHRTYFCRFGIPYFKSIERFPADQNDDIKEISRKNEIMLMRMPQTRRFTSSDARQLDLCILKQLKTKRIQNLQNSLSRLVPFEKGNNQFDQQRSNLIAAIENARCVKSICDTQDWNISVDFSSLPDLNCRFSSEDYERLWNLIVNPKLTRKDFSNDEIIELKKIAEKHGNQNWDRIAEELGTSRSGFSCFIKWVSVCKKGINVPWTAEENSLLLTMCSKLSDIESSGNTYLWWRNIRRKFPHRTYAQIHAHWVYVLKPSLKKGRFTPDENAMLEKLVEEGRTYSEIARIFENRSSVQLRAHYNSIIRRDDVKGPWTGEEEDQLLDLVAKYGSRDWVKISKELGTRNRSQCRLKYLWLVKRRQWTVKEKLLLVDLILKYGENYKKISEEIGSRTPEECMKQCKKEKFLRQNLNPKTGRSWSWSEKTIFMKLLESHGCDFEKISAEIGTRSTAQCEKYYKSIFNREPTTYNKLEMRTNRKEKRKIKVLEYDDTINEVIDQFCDEWKGEEEEIVPELVTNIKKESRSVRWKSNEKNRLKTLVQECNGNFDEISSRLLTKSPSQCKRMYEKLSKQEVETYKVDQDTVASSEMGSLLTKTTEKSVQWKEKEIDTFNNLLKIHGCNFELISKILETKTVRECEKRFTFLEKSFKCEILKANSCNASLLKSSMDNSPLIKKRFCKRNVWNPAEKDKLLELIDNCKKNFIEASIALGTKTERQCSRMYNMLKKTQSDNLKNQFSNCGNIKRRSSSDTNELKVAKKAGSIASKSWTPDEEEKLKELIEKHGCDFIAISKKMNTKTIQQCQQRFKKIQKISLSN